MKESDLFRAYRNLEVEEIKRTGDKEEEVEEEEVKTRLERLTISLEHQAHSARGENHWFTCPYCDDEDPDG